MNRDRALAELADLVEQLAEPHQHHEPIVDRDRHRNRTIRRAWSTRQDGLLMQLAAAAIDTTASEHASGPVVPGSRPPGGWEALALHAAITIGAVRWCWQLWLGQRDTVQANLRALVGSAPGLDDQTLTKLLADVRGWHHQAAVMTGWADPAYAPHVPCPGCEQQGGLRVHVSRRMAMCVRAQCGARWTPETIGVLADYIRAAADSRPARRVPIRSGRAGSGGWLPAGPDAASGGMSR